MSLQNENQDCRTLSSKEWRALCEEWEIAKPSQKTFCAEHNVSYTTFVSWRSKLLTERNQSRRQKFLAFDVSPRAMQTSRAELTMTLPNGITLTIPPGTNKHALSMTLDALGVRSC